jgi:Anti-sigma-K factor rskA, C-terminal
MSARDHSQIEELLAVRALGGLEPGDEAALGRAMAEHGPDCEECRRLEAEFESTAGLIGFALDPVPVDPAVADRILAHPRGPSTTIRPERPAHGRWWAVAAVAAAVVLVVVAGAVALRPHTQTIAGATFAQQVVTFQGGRGEVAMAYVPGEPGALIVGKDLPPPGADRTYEIWAITGTSPISAGCVSPTEGRVAAFTDLDVSSSDVMAITVESTACPSQPTTSPVYTAELA